MVGHRDREKFVMQWFYDLQNKKIYRETRRRGSVAIGFWRALASAYTRSCRHEILLTARNGSPCVWFDERKPPEA